MSLINTNEEMNTVPFAEESAENRLERLRDWERCHGVSFLLRTGGVCLSGACCDDSQVPGSGLATGAGDPTIEHL